MRKFKHSFANYPARYLGYVVSSYKICLQFEDVIVKTRVAYRDTSDLMNLPTAEYALPVTVNGVNINILAVGTPIEEIIRLQHSLINSYREYAATHSEYFLNKTGTDFRDELLRMKEKLDQLLEEV